MENFVRFAVYYAPEPGALANFAAAWLGWDPVAGEHIAHPEIAGLPRPVEALTATPRKYGFHGTLKPPFRLADGSSLDQLQSDLASLAARVPSVHLDGLALHVLGGFLALTPEGDLAPLETLAATVVEALDHHRAPASPEETARRMAAGLSPRQQALLAKWGYPFVMDEFRFHLTLTGKLVPGEARAVRAALTPVLAPILPSPFQVKELCLFGEDDEGMFHLLHRYPLSG